MIWLNLFGYLENNAVLWDIMNLVNHLYGQDKLYYLGGNIMVQSSSYIAIPPGATILELLYVREMSLEELSEKMGCSEEYISKLIDGTTPLTSNVALEIESVLGVPTLFWNNLESNYREQLFLVENEIKTILNGHSINYQ